MAYYRGVFRSSALVMNVHMACILPDEEPAQRTLILLHGLKGGCDDWVRYTSIERYARQYGMAVFMPEVQRSWYIDMAHGLKYFTFVSDELPQYIAANFRVPTDEKHLYIAGLSMGGFGALKCALTHPERYAGCVGLSGRYYIRDKIAGVADPTVHGEWEAILGADTAVGPENDLQALADAAAQADKRPRVYLASGTEDVLCGETLRLYPHLQKRGFDVKCETWSGIHDWVFWDAGIQKGLACVVK